MNFKKTLVSMLVSVVCYQFLFGWQAATTFILLLFTHEMGHVIFCIKRNVPCSSPIFIPFVGAAISLRPEDLKDARDEAWVGIGGPLVGGIGCLAASMLWINWYSNNQDIQDGIAFSIFVNAANLIPIRPLDGGRVTQIVGKWMHIPGAILLAIATWYTFSPILCLIWFAAIAEFQRKYPREESITFLERAWWFLGYTTLLAGLIILLGIVVAR